MKKAVRQPPKAQTPLSGINRASVLTLKWSGVVLVASVWGSAALFGLYILTFYAAAFYERNLERWNNVLPGLYEKGSLAATSGIGLHFAAGGIILVLGSLQLMRKIRTRYPALHRWVGRLYILSAILAAIGGLIFILFRGTIGGLVMDIGFAGYGFLMLLAAVQTYRYAATRRLEQHRAWALRLFALAIGSWLYRMDYGFWYLLTDAAGHNKQFNGPFDQVMAFFFYLPNLAVAQAFISTRQYKASVALRFAASFLLLFATVFLVIGTYYFTLFYWGPAIVRFVTGG